MNNCIKLTEAPRKRETLGALLTKQGRPDGVLRVAVVGGGCSGLLLGIPRWICRTANRDFLVESAGTKVVVGAEERPLRDRQRAGLRGCVERQQAVSRLRTPTRRRAVPVGKVSVPEQYF